MLKSLRLSVAAVGLSLAVLSGCASTPAPEQHAATQCYWPNPMQQDCREFIEFNAWR